MVNTKGHLTKEGYEEICKIQSGMNKSRYIKLIT